MNICAKYVKATLYKEATFALDSAYKYIQLTEINTKTILVIEQVP